MINVIRGSTFLKKVDKVVGFFLISFLIILKTIRVAFNRKNKHFNQLKGSSIGVCCYGAIGDLLLISECLTELKKHRPDLKTTLFCTASNKGVSELYPNLYDDVFVVSLTRLNPFSKRISLNHIDTIIDLNQWANISLIHCLMSKIICSRVLIRGFRRPSLWQGYDMAVPHLANVHESVNYHNLINDQTIQTNEELPNIFPRLFKLTDVKRNTSNILIHMWPSGTRAYLKEWPESYWVELCDYLMSEGYTLYFSGSPADIEKNRLFTQRLTDKHFVDLSGEKTLKELAAFIKEEVLLTVSVNTGILHLAYLFGSPVIGLHGPTDPKRWGPIGSSSISLLPEQGNFAYLNYGFEYPKDDKEAYSLQYLSVVSVLEAFNGLIFDYS